MSEVVEVAQFGNVVGGELAKAYLESYGVQSVLFDDNTAGALPGWGVRLMVLDSDVAEARRLLTNYLKEDERSGRGRSRPG